ncbi:hypothetical protein [Dactylosporangium matsuzakiense]|uniref:hypothetical protein n=1 Tax=Dactylosporangium matsuzakiense TaxID=53360 RepID=UPI0022F2DCF0|nr:hypothetical protein [Dactylosporangium matsuzakiense]
MDSAGALIQRPRERLLSRTAHTAPYACKAARSAGRRARHVPVEVCPPRRGFVHPASPADIVRVLTFFGPAATYGLRRIELRQRPGAGLPGFGSPVAELRAPGLVRVFEQPAPPWVLAGVLTPASRERLERAGALIAAGPDVTRVEWPDRTLHDFVLFDGLMHEIGHHAIQHAANKPRPVMRTADHERRADLYAAYTRAAWTAATA